MVNQSWAESERQKNSYTLVEKMRRMYTYFLALNAECRAFVAFFATHFDSFFHNFAVYANFETKCVQNNRK